jgi:hypothetical protein
MDCQRNESEEYTTRKTPKVENARSRIFETLRDLLKKQGIRSCTPCRNFKASLLKTVFEMPLDKSFGHVKGLAYQCLPAHQQSSLL